MKQFLIASENTHMYLVCNRRIKSIEHLLKMNNFEKSKKTVELSKIIINYNISITKFYLINVYLFYKGFPFTILFKFSKSRCLFQRTIFKFITTEINIVMLNYVLGGKKT